MILGTYIIDWIMLVILPLGCSFIAVNDYSDWLAGTSLFGIGLTGAIIILYIRDQNKPKKLWK